MTQIRASIIIMLTTLWGANLAFCQNVGLSINVFNPINTGYKAIFPSPLNQLDIATDKSIPFGFGAALMFQTRNDIQYRLQFGVYKKWVHQSFSETKLGTPAEASTEKVAHVMDYHATQKGWSIAPGFLYVNDQGNLLLKYGIELPLLLFSPFAINFTDDTDVLIESEEFRETSMISSALAIEVPGGFAFGFAGILGFDYKLGRHLRVGGELLPTISFLSLGGPTAEKVSGSSIFRRTYDSGEILDENVARDEMNMRQTDGYEKFQFLNRFQLMISCFF